MNNSKKTVAVIAEKNFRDEELLIPKEIFEQKNMPFVIASTTITEAIGKNGTKIKPDMIIDDINIRDFDALLFIGGAGCKQYLDNPVALSLAKEAVTLNKITGAICSAPTILAQAGVLKDKNATVFPADASLLENAGALYTKEALTVDGNIITADCVDSAKIFANKVIETLNQ